jgi:hypothetical protein
MARKKKAIVEEQVEEAKEPSLFDIISTHTWHTDSIATIIGEDDGNEKEITS